MYLKASVKYRDIGMSVREAYSQKHMSAGRQFLALIGSRFMPEKKSYLSF